VDANPRQTALLELKMAGIRTLNSTTTFASSAPVTTPAFATSTGRSCATTCPNLPAPTGTATGLVHQSPRQLLLPRPGGLWWRAASSYFRLRPQLAEDIRELFQCGDIATSAAIYDEKVAPELWTPTMNWVLGRQLTMSLMGVPHPQRRLVQAQHPDGVAGFMRAAIDYVFRDLPVADNYFWRVYLYGHYTPDCCPNTSSPRISRH
jgi:S-adenosylmethionine-diacylglycerol 3-amino-3-carboxypropyl transferase